MSLRLSVRALTLSSMNISPTSRPIATKFYLKHHWGGGKAALGFWPDQIGTLVSMATGSSHRVIMAKILLALKMKTLECSQDFSNYKSMGFFPDAQGQLTLQSAVGSGLISNSPKTL